MYLIGTNLKRLVEQRGICDTVLADDFSLIVKLGPRIFRTIAPEGKRIRYGNQASVDDCFKEEIPDGEVAIEPGESILACSADQFDMPQGYIGFLFTKGTLARLFVSITSTDPQVEPGFSGHITMEITNNAPWPIDLMIGSRVGQLYVAFCSNSEAKYSGRYLDAAKGGPTLPVLKND